MIVFIVKIKEMIVFTKMTVCSLAGPSTIAYSWIQSPGRVPALIRLHPPNQRSVPARPPLMHMICAGNDRWLGGCKWMSAGGLQRDWIQLYALVLGPARKNKHFGNNNHFLESEPLRHGLSHQTSDVNHGAGANKKKQSF